MARPRWFQSRRPAPEVVSRPRLEVLEDRTVLSGRNTLPEPEDNAAADLRAEFRSTESLLLLAPARDAEVALPGVGDRVPRDGEDTGGDAGNRSGGDPPPGFFYAEGPGYPLLPIALQPLFSKGGNNQAAQQTALASLSSPLALLPVRPHVPDAVPPGLLAS